jgi:peroxiredoxin/predicted 2-oxoglutarate/Fe(II)-dependent dioxygenase YbiX
MARFVNLRPGDPAPWFHQRSISNPRYAFDTAAGRYVVLCYFGTAETVQVRNAIEAVHRRTDIFDDAKACFFGVSVDPEDEAQKRVADFYPGFRYLWDFDATVAKLYGAMPLDAVTGRPEFRPLWFVLDPTLRVMKIFSFEASVAEVRKVLDYVAALPPPECHAGFSVPPPVLVLPNVLEPELCNKLIGLYEASGGQESGFMREVNGKTTVVQDHAHKRRRDYTIDDPTLISALQERFQCRVVPEIKKVHQYTVTRMERYIVACYAAEDKAHFRAHRDNTTKGTAHRRFAVSINLNSEFEGGEVSFPEYGPRSFKPPPGGAVVFSCSLLHAVSEVTGGRRFAFLPFLYDDEAAKIREANNAYLDESVGAYKVRN